MSSFLATLATLAAKRNRDGRLSGVPILSRFAISEINFRYLSPFLFLHLFPGILFFAKERYYSLKRIFLFILRNSQKLCYTLKKKF